jgi:hypothetical protein
MVLVAGPLSGVVLVGPGGMRECTDSIGNEEMQAYMYNYSQPLCMLFQIRYHPRTAIK